MAKVMLILATFAVLALGGCGDDEGDGEDTAGFLADASARSATRL